MQLGDDGMAPRGSWPLQSTLAAEAGYRRGQVVRSGCVFQPEPGGWLCTQLCSPACP